MKRNLFKYLISLISLIIFLIVYLSIAGIETEKFNQQIKDKVVQNNKNLRIDLKKVKLTLDPLKLFEWNHIALPISSSFFIEFLLDLFNSSRLTSNGVLGFKIVRLSSG